MLTSPKAHRLALCGLALTLLVSASCARSPQRSYYSLQSPAPPAHPWRGLHTQRDERRARPRDSARQR